jgi:hypothetical protein
MKQNFGQKKSKNKVEVNQTLFLEIIKNKWIRLWKVLSLLQVFLCSTIFLRLHVRGGVHAFRRWRYRCSTSELRLCNVFFFLHFSADYVCVWDLA